MTELEAIADVLVTDYTEEQQKVFIAVAVAMEEQGVTENVRHQVLVRAMALTPKKPIEPVRFAGLIVS